MPGLPERLAALDWLVPWGGARLRLKVAAAGEALRAGAPAERGQWWAALVGLAEGERRSVALAELVRLLPLMTLEGARDAAAIDLRRFMAASARLENTVAGLLRSGEAADRVGAMAAIQRVGLISLGERVAESLQPSGRDGPDAGTEAAEACLLSLASRAATFGPRQRRREGASLLARGIMHAVARIGEHRRAGVIEALCLLEEAGVRTHRGFGADGVNARLDGQAFISDPSHAALLALRRHIRLSGALATRAAAWRWVRIPTLTSACVARLAAPVTGGLKDRERQLGWMAHNAHLVVDPRRGEQLGRLVREDGAVPLSLVAVPAEVAGLSDAARRGYVMLLDHLPASSRLRDAALGSLLGDRSARVRHAVVRAAARLGRADCLLDLCLDSDTRVARSASLSLLVRTLDEWRGRARRVTGRDTTARTLRALGRSPSATVRAIAASAARVAGEGLVLEATCPLARVAWRRALSTPRHEAWNALSRAIDAAEPEVCVAAARLVRVLEAGEPIADRLIAAFVRSRRVGGDPGERMASALAGAVGDLARADATRALREALEDASPRVRAAAIDALARRLRRAPRPEDARALAEAMANLRDDAAHRPRASAARALVLLGSSGLGSSGSEHLGRRVAISMLRDERAGHQAAGLWVAERLADRLANQSEFVDAVTGLARRNPETLAPMVARRVERAAERLVIEIRSGWTRRAASVVAEPGDAGAAPTEKTTHRREAAA